MTTNDHFNIENCTSRQNVDALNKAFYEQYNFPWVPMSFKQFHDDCLLKVLNQDIGDYSGSRIRPGAKIWVAGCGTNQALITALKFPSCSVIGTDISSSSIDICQGYIEQIGVSNLMLEVKSINETDYVDEFDYIICTGVIHHNSDPKYTLTKISSALKQNGVLELMVYNYFHRILTTSFQKSIRTLCRNSQGSSSMTDYHVAKLLVNGFPDGYAISTLLKTFKDADSAKLADSLLQPVEYSYTVDSLQILASECNLQYILPCVNEYDAVGNSFDWNMLFPNEELNDLYYSLCDWDRWKITNQLKTAKSPMLWFYLQRTDSTLEAPSELQICSRFLNTHFEKVKTDYSIWLVDSKTGKLSNKKQSRYPEYVKWNDDDLLRTYRGWMEGATAFDNLSTIAAPDSFYCINNIRYRLTSMAFPYLIAT